VNLVLDTHILIWWQANDPKLSTKARAMIFDHDNSIFVSSLSLWEIAIKSALGKLEVEFDQVTQAVEDDGFTILNFTKAHARQVLALAPIHHDPFDRALIAQAFAESMSFITHDKHLQDYGPLIELV
jgi:PIN domain nuclease of toxin-antitoxin system